MADPELRDLERRYRSAEALEDEVAWLRARLRAGDLTEANLELLVYCGHKAACEMLGEDPPLRPEHSYEWECGFTNWGEDVEVAMVFACAERALEHARAVEMDVALRTILCTKMEEFLSAARRWRRERSKADLTQMVALESELAGLYFDHPGNPLDEYHSFLFEKFGLVLEGRRVNRVTGPNCGGVGMYLGRIVGEQDATATILKGITAHVLGANPS